MSVYAYASLTSACAPAARRAARRRAELCELLLQPNVPDPRAVDTPRYADPDAADFPDAGHAAAVCERQTAAAAEAGHSADHDAHVRTEADADADCRALRARRLTPRPP
eukprot:5554438-Pleurochrysis_carterae.AAC.2